MPSLPDTQAANAQYTPSYTPVAVFIGGTAGIGQAIAEALARYTNGRVDIIIIGQNEAKARQILAGLTEARKTASLTFKREFIKCNASEMKNVRKTCEGLRARLGHINYLVLSTGANSMAWAGETKEGLDYHLSLRYFSRFVFIEELASLLEAAVDLGQDARVMTVLGAGFGMAVPTTDMNNAAARNATYNCSKGILPCLAAIRAISGSAAYNDALCVWYAPKHPRLAFIHIHPGMVRTPTFDTPIDLGLAFRPLAWVLTRVSLALVSVSQDECAEHMLYALVHPANTHGVFFHERTGNLIASRVYDLVEEVSSDNRKGFVNGVQVKGYGGTDAQVRILGQFTEELTREK
ncbi:hypothetical protein C8R46DRAFT_1123876 [Mycena filopes]|nr:hypothetical protein C8R46DRAFT_1123876 [Mycena filopes]